MKERPILFSGEMVRAILDGRKTQTRRIMKPQVVVETNQHGYETHSWNWKSKGFAFCGGELTLKNVVTLSCPYGQPGDRLWVRETFCHITGGAIYDAAGGLIDSMDDEIKYRADRPATHLYKWTPSIYMPRWASRITLEITGVRVERLQDITDEDCHGEGAIKCARPDEFSVHSCIGVDGYAYLSPLGAFAGLWTKINGRESWNANPWVWVIEFKRVQT